MQISSMDNKNIKHLQSLKEKKYREQYNEFMVEGYHLVEEAYKNGSLKMIFKHENDEFNLPVETYEINDILFNKISSLNSSDQIIGICDKLNKNKIVGNKILILDAIQDPGNLGTIIRSAKAFNIKTIICSLDTVDVYNSKVLRATGGLIFDLNIIYTNLEKIIPNLQSMGYKVYATDVKDGFSITNIEKTNAAIVMGNEGNGVSEKIKNICDGRAHIKLNSEVESLNVAMATTIILYELDKE